MKITYFFLLMLIIDTPIYQDESRILWNKDYKLSWSEFWQIPPPKDIYPNVLAMSGCLISCNYVEQEKSPPKFEVKAYFVKDSSWTRTQAKEILEHEQLHFDMTELYARKIRKGIDSLTSKRVLEINSYLEIVSKYTAEMDEAHNSYDKETLLLEGIINDRLLVQKKWIDSIAIELGKLKKYEYKE